MKSQSGSIRWRREGNLLYVKWNEASMVSIDSTIHKAYEKDTTVKRKKRLKDGSWTTVLRQTDHVPVPCKPPVCKRKRASLECRSYKYCLDEWNHTHKTPWKCKVCEVAQCVIPDRNCFEKWHSKLPVTTIKYEMLEVLTMP
ncbi:unnamed protein product [Coregonus sp. 'balchen']|nr:unnamed protein product [Coregonus sp. 'balchen']